MLLTLQSSFKSDPECEEITTHFEAMPEYIKQLLPYTGRDTLYFLTNTNDTCNVRGTGKQTIFTAYPESQNGLLGCDDDYVRREGYQTKYFPIKAI